MKVTPASSSKKKKKEDIDEAIKSGNVSIIPPMSCVELIDEITRNGMLKNIPHYYEHLDDNEQKEIEEVVLLYLDIYKKALLEIAKQILTQLYNNLNARRLSSMEEVRHIKIQALLTNCGSITSEEMDGCLKTANRMIFKSRHMTVSLMVGRVKEIISETNEAWVKFFIENPNSFTSPEANPKSHTSDIPIDGKGKGVVDSPSTILKDAKELNAKSPTEANVQNKEEIQAEKVSV